MLAEPSLLIHAFHSSTVIVVSAATEVTFLRTNQLREQQRVTRPGAPAQVSSASVLHGVLALLAIAWWGHDEQVVCLLRAGPTPITAGALAGTRSSGSKTVADGTCNTRKAIAFARPARSS